MRLSKATASDFEFCESLYGKQATDMIYRWERNEVNTENVNRFSSEFFITDEIWGLIKEEVKFNREKFMEQLSKKHMKIFIIYDDNNSKIGYCQLTSIGSTCWKLEFMFLKEENKEFNVFKKAIDLLNKKIQTIEVCIIDDEVKTYFLKAGFEEFDKFFFKRIRGQSKI